MNNLINVKNFVDVAIEQLEKTNEEKEQLMKQIEELKQKIGVKEYTKRAIKKYRESHLDKYNELYKQYYNRNKDNEEFRLKRNEQARMNYYKRKKDKENS